MGENIIDCNFRMIDYEVGTKKLKGTVLRARFDKSNLADGKYCDNNGLDKTTFSKLLKRRVKGTYLSSDDGGNTAKIIKQLKTDGIWSGPLPWEE